MNYLCLLIFSQYKSRVKNSYSRRQFHTYFVSSGICCCLVFAFVLIAIITSCEDDNGDALVDSKQEVITQMLDIAQMHSIRRDQIDWQEVRSSTLTEFNNDGFEKGVLKLLMQLDDNHSFYLDPRGIPITYRSFECNSDFDFRPIQDSEIGYLKVDGFTGTDEEAKTYAQNIQISMETQDDGVKLGWVVDLSTNSGGILWPMITALGPIFGDGPLGYFSDADGVLTEWGYAANGSYLESPTNLQMFLSTPYEIKSPIGKIAVVVDNATISSGEAVAIAFSKIANVKLFGNSTCGLSTINKSFPLSDGSALLLTIAVMADSEAVLYGGSVDPDIFVSDEEELMKQIDIWLRE